jgi:hypothetical protein
VALPLHRSQWDDSKHRGVSCYQGAGLALGKELRRNKDTPEDTKTPAEEVRIGHTAFLASLYAPACVRRAGGPSVEGGGAALT